MPSSGELRLRTLILALTALGGIWIALVIQRAHHAPAAAFASGPQPADFAAPKLVRVPGLNRPVAATPIANVVAARSSLHARADQADPGRADQGRCRQAD